MLAVNPVDGIANIQNFRRENADLTFPMLSVPYGWSQAFSVTGYPTTVVIDKDGIVRKVHVGALRNVSDWVSLVEQYT